MPLIPNRTKSVFRTPAGMGAVRGTWWRWISSDMAASSIRALFEEGWKGRRRNVTLTVQVAIRGRLERLPALARAKVVDPAVMDGGLGVGGDDVLAAHGIHVPLGCGPHQFFALRRQLLGMIGMGGMAGVVLALSLSGLVPMSMAEHVRAAAEAHHHEEQATPDQDRQNRFQHHLLMT